MFSAWQVVLFALVLLSLCGQISFLRLRFRLPFGVAVLIDWTILCTVLFISGFLGIIGLIAQLFFLSGLGFLLWRLRRDLTSHSAMKWHLIQRLRHSCGHKEYWFLLGICGIFFHAFMTLFFEHSSPDFIRSFYPHFCFLKLYEKWPLGDFENYANYYAMILDANLFYFSKITQLSNTHFYSLLYCFAGLAALAGCLANVRFRKMSAIALLSLSYGWFYGLTWGDTAKFSTVHIWISLGIALLFFIIMVIRSVSSVRDLLQIFLVMLFATFFLMVENPMYQFNDEIIACFSIGISAAYFLYFRKHDRHLWLLSFPLLVETFVKPTGCIFAIFTAVTITACEISRRRQISFWKSWRHLSTALLLLSIPIIAHVGWNKRSYADGIRKHHQMVADWPLQMKRHWRNGFLPAERERLQRNWRNLGKLPIESKLAIHRIHSSVQNAYGSMINNHFPPLKNVDFGEKNPHLLFYCFVAAILIGGLPVFMPGDRKDAVLMGAMVLACAALTLFNQGYWAHLFFATPCLTRYLFPGIMPMIALPMIFFCRIVTKQDLWKVGIPCAIVIAAAFFPLFSFTHQYIYHYRISFPHLSANYLNGTGRNDVFQSWNSEINSYFFSNILIGKSPFHTQADQENSIPVLTKLTPSVPDSFYFLCLGFPELQRLGITIPPEEIVYRHAIYLVLKNRRGEYTGYAIPYSKNLAMLLEEATNPNNGIANMHKRILNKRLLHWVSPQEVPSGTPLYTTCETALPVFKEDLVMISGFADGIKSLTLVLKFRHHEKTVFQENIVVPVNQNRWKANLNMNAISQKRPDVPFDEVQLSLCAAAQKNNVRVSKVQIHQYVSGKLFLDAYKKEIENRQNLK